MIKLTIPGPPCAKQRPKVYGKHAVTPEKTVNYETLVKHLYIAEHYGKKKFRHLVITKGAEIKEWIGR